jgi:hypothetical protein
VHTSSGFGGYQSRANSGSAQLDVPIRIIENNLHSFFDLLKRPSAAGSSHLSLGEGDYGFSDFLAVLRFDLVGPAIFADVITVTVVSTVVRSEDVCPWFCGEEMRTNDVWPPKLNHPGLIFKTSHSCLGGDGCASSRKEPSQPGQPAEGSSWA